jgi:HEAT repeat protein/beta-lactamase regulating signal transducer with metallopeptidase domain
MTPTQVLGWTLVHFLWQGALVAIALAGLLHVTRRYGPGIRYHAALAGLAVLVLCPVFTAARLADRPAPIAATDAPVSLTTTIDDPSGVAAPDGKHAMPEARPVPVAKDELRVAVGDAAAPAAAVLRARIEPILPGLVVVWFAGVLLLSIRLLGGVARTRRLARDGTAPARAILAAAFARLAQRLGVHAPVRLLESTALGVPAVVGWLKPVVLLPVAAAAGLTPQQLELLLAHELAHVRRNDYLVNLLQSVVETLLFYHPVVWWISARVREEREHCCDDAALAVCGHPHAYAGALLALAEWRAPALAPAAVGGGSLLRRVRRILGHDAGAVELGPFWVAGLLAAALALTVVGGVRVTSATPVERNERIAEKTEGALPLVGDTGRPRPDTIIRYVGDEPLAARSDWAARTAATAGFDGFWVGYAVPASGAGGPWHYLDRYVPFHAGDVRFTGHLRFTGGLGDFRLDGVAPTTLLGERPPRDLVILLGFAGATGDAGRLVRVHLSNWVFPIHFAGMPLLWLGEVDDAQSVARLRAAYAATSSRDLKDDLIGMVGAHTDPDAVVPALRAWLESGEPDELRGEAAEALGYQPTAESLQALTRAALRDRSREVRAESIEALGDLELPAATDALTEVLGSVGDRSLRVEAAEALGERRDDKARAALQGLVRDDRDRDVQRAAVEALGRLPDGAGLRDLLEIARRHSSAEIRAEAVESLGELDRAAEVRDPLVRIAREDPHPDVQREAVETLGDLGDPDIVPILLDLVRTHPRGEVQREAVETLAQVGELPAVLSMLAEIARTHPRVEVQVEAVERIGDLDHPDAPRTLQELAHDHPREEVRLEAVESLGTVAPVDTALAMLERIVWRHPDVNAQREAAETIGELELDAAVALLEAIIERHPRVEVQVEAVESLGKHPEAVPVLRRLIDRHPRADVRREAVETLGEFDESGVVDALIGIAREHRDIEARREAITNLGERHPTEDIGTALVALVRDDPDRDVREEALEALAELEDGVGVPRLVETARTHPDSRTRVRAIELLGDSDDPRAREALRNLIRP